MLRRLLPVLLAAAAPLAAQTGSVALSDRAITPQEWNRLRNVVESLRTEEGTRKLYRESQGVQSAYPAEPYFLSYIQKWRPRLESLPRERARAENVSLTLKELEEGDEWIMTVHHAKPKFAITMIKTSWKDGQLMNISFTRGFTEVNRGRGVK
jgi:hypothetical protein